MTDTARSTADELVLTRYFNGPSWHTMSRAQIDEAIRHLAGKGQHDTVEKQAKPQ